MLLCYMFIILWSIQYILMIMKYSQFLLDQNSLYYAMLIFHAYYWLGMHDLEQMYVFAPWGVRRYTRKRVYVAKRRLYKGQKISKANYGFLDSPKKWTKLTILSEEGPQDSEFLSFCGRIEDRINCFWGLLTFRTG